MKNLVLRGAVEANTIVMIVIVVLLLVALIVLPMITNKKRQNHVQELHNSIAVGDTVKTVGGIVGKIIAINDVNAVDKEFVLETGVDGSKATMVFDFNAIYQVMSKATKPVEVKKEAAPAEKPVEVAVEEKTADAAVEEKTDDKPAEKTENK